jgi:hypothetical protein
MASTYTTGFGIEKIGSGEQSGAWGTTTNHNLDILDRIASYKAVALSGTTHTLTVREASPGSGTENLQDGMYRVIKFTGALGGNNTVTIAPNTAPAYFIFENATTDSGSSGPYSVILTQGSGANITIQNGKNAIVYCDGAGSGAAVVNALSDLQIATLEVTGVAAIDGALTAAAITATTVTTSGIVSVDDTTTSTSGTTGSIHTDGGLGVAGTAFVAGAATVGGASQFNSTVTVGVNDTGYDVQFFGATSGAHMLWDESADDLKLVGAAGLTVAGNIDVDGTTNLDAVDIDGAVQLDGTLTVGVNDTGYDVKFFGAASGSYMLWDESTDDLILGGAAQLGIGTTAPYSQLDVYSTIASPTSGEASGVGTIRITNGATALTSAGGLEFKNAGDSNGYGAKIQALNSSGAQLVFANRGASATWTERMRIAADGKVGIGMTPVASYGLLQVGSAVTSAIGVGGLQAFISGTNSALGQNGNLAIITTTALAANIGGSIGLGGKFVASGLSVLFAHIAGRKENGTDNNSAGYLQFATQTQGGVPTEKMRLNSVGQLLIGKTTPSAAGSLLELHTAGNVANVFYMLKAAQVEMAMGFKSSSDANFYLGTGSTNVGTSGQGVYLTNGGANWVSNSDFRKKKNLVPIENALDKIANCRAVTGHYKHEADDVKKRPFLIAQDWVTALPEAVDEDTVDDDGVENLGLSYEGTIPLLVAAIKELREQNIALTNRITALEG